MSPNSPTNQWREIETTWDGASGYLARNQAGVTTLMGTAQDGQTGIGPMDLLLAGLAGCTMIDVVDILRKKRQTPLGFKTIVRGNQRLDQYPKRYTEYQVEYLLWGENLVEKDVAQAIQLSEEKYCSAGGTLSQAGPIHSNFRILKPGENA